MSDFLIDRSELRTTKVVDAPRPEIATGEALLAVDTFGLTANNITYAVFGDAMSYWSFFPSGHDGWARMPVWGFATVTQSAVDGVAEGARVYGYLPPSSWLAVTPVRVGPDGFADGAAHRAELPAAYQGYAFCDTDPFYRADTEALQMLLRPLFYTSFLIDDQLDDDGLAARGPVLISSASSKTAIGAAYLLAQRPGAETVGLTSQGNAEFVRGLDIYSSVVTYDEIGTLAAGPATYVDISGDGAVRAAVHTRFGDDLLHSMVVGATHWEDPAPRGGERLPGPPPTFFFAPTRVVKRGQDWGRGGLDDRVAESWQHFCGWSAAWLQTIEATGFDAVQAAYHDVLEGAVAPQAAHVLKLDR